MKTILEVLQAFGQAIMSGTDSWKEYLSEEIEFSGPDDSTKGKVNFAKLNESFTPLIDCNTLKTIIDKDQWVITQVEFKIRTPKETSFFSDITEWHEITYSNTISTLVYYDTEGFRKEIGLKN